MYRIGILTFICFFFGNMAKAQVAEDLAVELTATVQTSPAHITLKWKLLTIDTPTYVIWRKAKTATSFGSPIASLPATDSIFTDTTVVADSSYEYQVFAEGTYLWSSGYLFAGIKSPAIHHKGALVLMVDSLFTDSCAAEIDTLMKDISGDGWQIFRHDVSRNLSDTDVYAMISGDYASHVGVRAVLLLGHVAVPYSGAFDSSWYPPDGHMPYHDGAWPSDVYYACIGGGWTDTSVIDTSGSYISNWNIIGDGKWDQILMPSAALLQVSRIDFYNMPSFTATEPQMMNTYLARDHRYKMDSLSIIPHALVDDNFGYFGGEAFAANGWRNFAPLLGADSTFAIPFISSLAASSYQWAYGCGGGSFNSASGIGATSDFAANPVNGIFTMMFGSYFGDWNVQDNFLRAPLCASVPALTCCWAGRPNWFFHHMALGENIGYSTWLTHNNAGGLYQPTNYGAGWIHVALMGDLTLRTNYIQPPSNLVITNGFRAGATLNWTASADTAVLGYYVYRADSVYGYYQRLDSAMLTGTTYTDTIGTDGLKYYMVRPVKLQSTPSGTYYNLGVGITDTATISYFPLQITSLDPVITLSLFPNPAHQYINVNINIDQSEIVTMYITDESGHNRNMTTRQLMTGSNHFSLNISGYAPGNYSLIMVNGANKQAVKWVKE